MINWTTRKHKFKEWKVKRGRHNAYSLKPMEDFIVATDLLARDKKVAGRDS